MSSMLPEFLKWSHREQNTGPVKDHGQTMQHIHHVRDLFERKVQEDVLRHDDDQIKRGNDILRYCEELLLLGDTCTHGNKHFDATFLEFKRSIECYEAVSNRIKRREENAKAAIRERHRSLQRSFAPSTSTAALPKKILLVQEAPMSCFEFFRIYPFPLSYL
uniref:MIT domain-containing protein n=1 Tax=Caenorhabditis tropicalis TaxID=1561998 RepID=A0A1I7UPT8_9PELO